LNKPRLLKELHLASTLWFILCTGFLFVYALREAGVRWFVIFSLSGYSTIFVFLMVSFYLIAIFRGVSQHQHIQIEHPLTSTNYYIIFYMMSPFLGGLAGFAGSLDVPLSGFAVAGSFGLPLDKLFIGTSLGTLAMTSAVWVVVDPILGFLELFLPGSRQNRQNRLECERRQAEQLRLSRERLIQQAIEFEQQTRLKFDENLMPYAARLAEMLESDAANWNKAEQEAVEIGLKAWQLGGLNCMKYLRELAIASYKEKYTGKNPCDYISSWWDGIGNWRSQTIS
jgi:hypothetical protein